MTDGGREDKKKERRCEEEQGPLMFLEELKSISIMNRGLSEKRSKGRPEDGAMEDGEDRGGEDMKALWSGEYICQAISVRLPHEQTHKKSKR